MYLDTGPTQWPQAVAELDGLTVGQLLTPLTNYAVRADAPTLAVDNGGFCRQDFAAFERTLAKAEPHRRRVQFVAVPDVPGDGRRTLELFEHFAGRLRGWPLALVTQDGMEHLTIPWCQIAAVFVGGFDPWKESPASVAIMRAARWRGKHVHVGRVNTSARLRKIGEQVRIDSIDGSGISQYSHMRRDVRAAVLGTDDDPRLFDADAA